METTIETKKHGSVVIKGKYDAEKFRDNYFMDEIDSFEESQYNYDVDFLSEYFDLWMDYLNLGFMETKDWKMISKKASCDYMKFSAHSDELDITLDFNIILGEN